MNSTSKYQRPFVICRWPGRSQEGKHLATRILSMQDAVETTMGIRLAWAADVGSADEFAMVPFLTDLEPVDVELDNNVCMKGGLALPLYGSVSSMPEGEMVSVRRRTPRSIPSDSPPRWFLQNQVWSFSPPNLA
ncbi:hypothetical protein ACFRJ9_02440 [Paenarthrobacter sp. NPDC056912]|uniref:hypothetical protein n=1 Tax=Paenarthrobacter sp. NPDC056912 TaxID=3345965 RepID=UPI00366D7E64